MAADGDPEKWHVYGRRRVILRLIGWQLTGKLLIQVAANCNSPVPARQGGAPEAQDFDDVRSYMPAGVDEQHQL